MATFVSALVIGASSGIGEALARRLAQDGTYVAVVARRRDRLQQLVQASGGRIRAYVHDVEDLDAAPELFDRIIHELGAIDLVVYAAGVMPPIEEGEYNTAKDRQILAVNLTGAVAWLNLAAGYMEARKRGTLCAISSVAGDRGRRGNPAYTAAKGGLTTFLEALRNRLSRYGVHVVTVKPGPVETPMTEGIQMPLMIPVDVCVDGIVRLLEQQRPLTGYVPGIWRWIMLIIRSVPSFIFRRTNI